MWLVIAFFVGICIAVWGAIFSAIRRELVDIWTCSLIAFFALTTLVFVTAPLQLGEGHVHDTAENYAKRLDAGVAYQRIAVKSVGDDVFVVLVNKTGTTDYTAIRVKDSSPPPEYFTLVDDKPVAIAPPTPPVTLSHPLGGKK